MKSIATAAYEDEDGIRTVLTSREDLDRAVATGKIRSDTPVTVYFDDRTSSRQLASSVPQLAESFTIAELRTVEDGEPKDRFSAASLEFAISVGEIASDTDVQLEFTDGGKVIAPAGSLPLLAKAFKSQQPSKESPAEAEEPADGADPAEEPDAGLVVPVAEEPEETAEASEPDVEPEPEIDQANELPEPGADDLAEDADAQDDEPAEEPEIERQPAEEPIYPPQGPSNTGKYIGFGAIGVVLLLLLVWLLGGSGHYAAADAPIYTQPSAGSVSAGEVPYGTELSLMPSDAEGWLEITEGPFSGSFISEDFLTDDEPPPLDRSAAGSLTLPRSARFYGVADQSAESLGSYGPGTILTVTGSLEGNDGAQYLLFEAAGGKAMERPVFMLRSQTEAPPPITAPTPKIVEPEEALPEPEQTERPERETTPERCRSRPAGIDRLVCENPRVASLDRALSREWYDARQRFAAQGQTITPLETFRERASTCRTERCATQRLQQAIDLIKRQQPEVRETAAPPPPPPPVDRSRQAEPRRDLRSYFRNSDYPRRAEREGRQGNVTVMLTVGANGRVSGCNVTGSSGHSDLDKETCDVLRKRARFTPAADQTGRATTGGYGPVSIGWQLGN